jgi:hypothetical protein
MVTNQKFRICLFPTTHPRVSFLVYVRTRSARIQEIECEREAAEMRHGIGLTLERSFTTESTEDTEPARCETHFAGPP